MQLNELWISKGEWEDTPSLVTTRVYNTVTKYSRAESIG